MKSLLMWRHAATHTDTQSDRHTSSERMISIIHYIHLAEITKSIVDHLQCEACKNRLQSLIYKC